jgi:hypothetical protein
MRSDKNMAKNMVTVYNFPNGFGKEAMNTYKELMYYRLNPKWEFPDDGSQSILLSKSEAEGLINMAEFTPRIWGNASTIKETIEKYKNL